MFEEHICLSLYSTSKNTFPCTSFVHWRFLVTPGPNVNRNVVFVCIKAHPSWTMNGAVYAGQDGCIVPRKSIYYPSFYIPCCLLSALAIIAWPSLTMQWEMAALHNTYCGTLPPTIWVTRCTPECFLTLLCSPFLTLYFPDPGHFSAPTHHIQFVPSLLMQSILSLFTVIPHNSSSDKSTADMLVLLEEHLAGECIIVLM